MTPRHAFAAYESAIRTTPPLQAVVLLYDGILMRLHQAAAAAGRGDTGAQFTHVRQAAEIVRGLASALDMKRGGPLAANLRRTYYANIQAMMGTVGHPNAAAALGTIAEGLRELRNAWGGIAGLPPSCARNNLS